MKKSNINEDKNNGVIRHNIGDRLISSRTSHLNTFISIVLSVIVTLMLISDGSTIVDCVEEVKTSVFTMSDNPNEINDTIRTIVPCTTETSTVPVTTTTVEQTTTETTTQTTQSTTVTTTTTETTVCEISTEPIREYIVFKPGTHYVHKSTCRWFDKTCYEITTTDGIEARKCTECNPDIEIMTEYVEPTPEVVAPAGIVYNFEDGYPIGSDGRPHAALNYVTEEERIYLCNTVAQEYGCDWVSQYDKALVVAVVMNRLADGGWQGRGRANTIYNILTAPNQFNPAYAVAYYRHNVTESCIAAVDYYFENQDSFPHYTSFWGDGSVNHFR